ncbi:hypothetical protein [uncultured virus]|uniref:Uncharacterized protein n=1 Tax=uncultured virus TaxID=340016 RepID=A0A218MLS7_9VIRU|nr:hypothetical protein [uncultured virus]
MAFKMSGWSAFTKADDKKETSETKPEEEKKTGKIEIGIKPEEEKKTGHRKIYKKITIPKKTITKVERSENSKKLEELRKTMKKQ